MELHWNRLINNASTTYTFNHEIWRFYRKWESKVMCISFVRTLPARQGILLSFHILYTTKMNDLYNENVLSTAYIYTFLLTRSLSHLFQPHSFININPNAVMFIYKPPEYITQQNTRLGIQEEFVNLEHICSCRLNVFFFSYLWLLDASQMDNIMPIINAAQQYRANIFNVCLRKKTVYIHDSIVRRPFPYKSDDGMSPQPRWTDVTPQKHTELSYLVHCLIMKAILCRDGDMMLCHWCLFKYAWRP